MDTEEVLLLASATLGTSKQFPELAAAAPALDSPGPLGSKWRERPSRAEVPDTRSCWEKAIRLCRISMYILFY